MWWRVRAIFGYCPSWRYTPGDLGRPMKVWCRRGLGHQGKHRWLYREWE